MCIRDSHNRLVVTVVGEPDALKEAVIEAIGIAVELIDLNHHQGQHPRMGAVDAVNLSFQHGFYSLS